MNNRCPQNLLRAADNTLLATAGTAPSSVFYLEWVLLGKYSQSCTVAGKNLDVGPRAVEEGLEGNMLEGLKQPQHFIDNVPFYGITGQ